MLSAAANADVKNLCATSENTVWSCQTAKKTYSLCASKDLAKTKGYLQYRAGTEKKIEFKFPTALIRPQGQFESSDSSTGNVFLEFSTGGYTYTIAEDKYGDAAIYVTKASKTVATIFCSDSTGTLGNNSTQDLFKSAGIPSD